MMLTMTSIGLSARDDHNTHLYQVTNQFFQLIISDCLAVSLCVDRQTQTHAAKTTPGLPADIVKMLKISIVIISSSCGKLTGE